MGGGGPEGAVSRSLAPIDASLSCLLILYLGYSPNLSINIREFHVKLLAQPNLGEEEKYPPAIIHGFTVRYQHGATFQSVC